MLVSIFRLHSLGSTYCINYVVQRDNDRNKLTVPEGTVFILFIYGHVIRILQRVTVAVE